MCIRDSLMLWLHLFFLLCLLKFRKMPVNGVYHFGGGIADCFKGTFKPVSYTHLDVYKRKHIDKGHVHNHIIFCSVNFVDYQKYNSNERSYYGILNMSDRLCRENGLSVVTPQKGRQGKELCGI